MKTILFVFLAVLFTGSSAFAGWQENFSDNYNKNGLDAAVAKALAEGITPEKIIEAGMDIEGVDGKMLAAAMCNNAIPVHILQNLLTILKISPQTAINVCQSISTNDKFPGSGYSSVAKGTNYDGSNNKVKPASGHNFQ